MKLTARHASNLHRVGVYTGLTLIRQRNVAFKFSCQVLDITASGDLQNIHCCWNVKKDFKKMLFKKKTVVFRCNGTGLKGYSSTDLSSERSSGMIGLDAPAARALSQRHWDAALSSNAVPLTVTFVCSFSSEQLVLLWLTFDLQSVLQKVKVVVHYSF